MTTQEEIDLLEAALAAMPIGVTSVKDAAGNQTNFDRAQVEARLDSLKSRLATASGFPSFGISKIVSSGAND